jgi:hypothetical protein
VRHVFAKVHGLTLWISEALIEDINTDKRVALRSLSREGYMKFGVDPNLNNNIMEGVLP